MLIVVVAHLLLPALCLAQAASPSCEITQNGVCGVQDATASPTGELVYVEAELDVHYDSVGEFKYAGATKSPTHGSPALGTGRTAIRIAHFSYGTGSTTSPSTVGALWVPIPRITPFKPYPYLNATPQRQSPSTFPTATSAIVPGRHSTLASLGIPRTEIRFYIVTFLFSILPLAAMLVV